MTQKIGDVQVVLNKFGYYEVKDKPSVAMLEEFYSIEYYTKFQFGMFDSKYSTKQIEFFQKKIAEKYFVIEQNIDTRQKNLKFLDVGCGEGFALDFFKKKNWGILGLDYSERGCKNHNPSCLSEFIVGDPVISMDKLISENQTFDVIWLDNVLEHVLEPVLILKKCYQLIKGKGLLMVEVPNDFSVLQEYLFNNKHVDHKFWITYPDHISYFNRIGLVNLLNSAGWKNIFSMTDTVIDFNLLNECTNYIKNKTLGKPCHEARMELEILITNQSIEKAVNYYRAVCELGLGRQIISYFNPI